MPREVNKKQKLKEGADESLRLKKVEEPTQEDRKSIARSSRLKREELEKNTGAKGEALRTGTVRLAGTEEFVPISSVSLAEREAAAAQFKKEEAIRTELEQEKLKQRIELEPRTEEERLAQQEAIQTAEETGVFEKRPERVDLDVQKGEQRQGAFYKNFFSDPIGTFKKIISGDTEELDDAQLNDLISNPETMRQKLLQEIQREELDKSRTISQKFGAALEPYVGDLKVADVDIGGYIDQIVRMPKRETDEILNQMNELEGTISGMTDAAAQGEIGNPQEVLRDIADKEEQIYRLEARIKRLIIESPELRANPEQVNIIEAKIQKIKETAFEAKQRAAEGALITPTNERLYFRLKELRG